MKVDFQYAVYNQQTLAETDEHASFLAQDVLDLIEPHMSVVEITHIHVDPELRRLGVASDLIKKLQVRYAADVIVVAAGATGEEYPEEPSAEQYEELFFKLDKLYTSLGFVNINTFVGYEGKVAYVWDNGRADRVLAKEKKAVDWQQKRRQSMQLTESTVFSKRGANENAGN